LDSLSEDGWVHEKTTFPLLRGVRYFKVDSIISLSWVAWDRYGYVLKNPDRCGHPSARDIGSTRICYEEDSDLSNRPIWAKAIAKGMSCMTPIAIHVELASDAMRRPAHQGRLGVLISCIKALTMIGGLLQEYLEESLNKSERAKSKAEEKGGTPPGKQMWNRLGE
jgi:hypothetical protein